MKRQQKGYGEDEVLSKTNIVIDSYSDVDYEDAILNSVQTFFLEHEK